MSDFVVQSVEILPPQIPEVTAVSTSASAAIDISGASLGGGKGRFLTFVCIEGTLYIKFGTSTVAAPDETATSGDTRCFAVAAGYPFSVYVPANVTHVRFKASASGYARYYLSSP